MSEIDKNKVEPKEGTEIFRPYARLISILGDQLISNKWVGVIELVKNCYDADAEKVTVRFLNLDNKKPTVIEIEDDGDGMDLRTIIDVWMKPATPNKLSKKNSESRFTNKGRLMQGDKGVGRFAVYKLGNAIEIYTKRQDKEEVNLSLNFREFAETDEYSEEVVSTDKAPKFLDEIPNSWKKNDTPIEIVNSKGKGTLIRISDLRNNWKVEDLDKLDKAFYKMIPPVIPKMKENVSRDFSVEIVWDEEVQPSNIMPFEQIIELAPYSFSGSIDVDGKLTYLYTHNKEEHIEEIDLFEDEFHDIKKLKLFKEQFYQEVEENRKKVWRQYRKPDVGEFSFFLYSFDWTKKSDAITKVQEDYIKENSVYLYRDLTRVYPYGERGVDWLMLSKFRAEDKAGNYFSYNDLTGFVFIKQKNNPKLRDAADREGLMNIDGVYDDFVALMQAGLKVMKDLVAIDRRKDDVRKTKPLNTANEVFDKAFTDLRDTLALSNDKSLLDKSKKLFDATTKLVTVYKENLSISQELAGVGMAVEKSSHDTFVLIKKLQDNALRFSKRFAESKLDPLEFETFLKDLTGGLDVLYTELQVLQPLFRVARKITKDVSVKDVATQLGRFFQRELNGKITYTIIPDDDIVLKTNTGLVLQVLINLMDNAVYWVNQKEQNERLITLKINSDDNTMIFADNGNGISDDLKEIVFLEFYSTKTAGRGLGLYIVRELLERIGAEISIVTEDHQKILPGANFIIHFKN
jgi:signal transduction histidine kinase